MSLQSSSLFSGLQFITSVVFATEEGTSSTIWAVFSILLLTVEEAEWWPHRRRWRWCWCLASSWRESQSRSCASLLKVFKEFKERHDFCLHCDTRYLKLRKGIRERCTKKQKKLTNVSLVCMYVGRKSEMSVFSVFFPNRSNLSTISMVA